jgi:hypothetical protein
MLDEALDRAGFARANLRELPILSDEGSARELYAQTHHNDHYLCYWHLLKSLGSETLGAMLAHRLFFTKTEAGFQDLIDQTRSDLIAAYRDGRVSEPGARKFCKIFGVTTPAPTDLTSMPSIDREVFRKQAQWGTRGASGVGTCTNHIEG